ncbi:hypothetical protein [Vibrio metschnikovii]|uniref:hypothetical protein n=1 Tax=Vibrio metschnikovii TaxID=28172 RepID=UPI0013024B0D|nr:hypothetical protein [Vibrio metschnikovii]
MEMNVSLLQAFNATQGAGSEVTIREATGDKSVTIDQSEKAVLFQIYPSTTFTRAGGLSLMVSLLIYRFMFLTSIQTHLIYTNWPSNIQKLKAMN